MTRNQRPIIEHPGECKSAREAIEEAFRRISTSEYSGVTILLTGQAQAWSPRTLHL